MRFAMSPTPTCCWPAAAATRRSCGAWLTVHIVVSVATYALCTLAAVCSLAVVLQERALKRKRADLY